MPISRSVAPLAALLLVVLLPGPCSAEDAPAAKRPNFVVIFADDLGYGDLACYGHPSIATPNLDRMASEGIRFTQFYSASSVCTPSRAALLTGRLPIRNGMCSDRRRVLFPDSGGGIPAEEVTLAEGLSDVGYASGAFGKWHLGHLPQFLPTSNGFDTYFGIPYSNDMDRVNDVGPRGRAAFRDPNVEYWDVPLIRDTEVVERPADQTTITRRYTEEAADFIRAHKEEPFFVYLAHSMPHVPLFRSPEFEGRSRRGLYGDVIEEIDWSVGQILQTLREEGLAETTLVWFTSDNGPWLIFGDHGGSAGPLKDGKGCTWDGGMRVPGLAWWPGTIPAGTVTMELGSTMDIFTTCLAQAGGTIPADRVIDGVDLTPVLTGSGEGVRDHMFYYRGTELM
ncbi:MAG: sulfatase, partial [Maioricimonas sp. JB049]